MINCLEQDDQIQVWQVQNGKITQMKIQGGLFLVKPDTKVDPIKAAKAFLEAFDIGRTTIVRKAMGELKPTTTVPSTTKEQTTKRHKRIQETGEVVGKVNNLPIIKEKIIGFFRKHSDQFTTDNMKNYWMDMYIYNIPAEQTKPTELTVLNKQRATLKWLVNKGYVKQIEGKGNYHRKYEWKERPWGAEPAAQADVNPKYLIDLQKRELMAYREG